MGIAIKIGLSKMRQPGGKNKECFWRIFQTIAK
jgi:hypothetical protein